METPNESLGMFFSILKFALASAFGYFIVFRISKFIHSLAADYDKNRNKIAVFTIILFIVMGFLATFIISNRYSIKDRVEKSHINPDQVTCSLYPPGGLKEDFTLAQALSIAKNSTCADVGRLTTENYCNTSTKKWWIEIDPFEEMPNCDPACVVDMFAESAEIALRCK